MTKLNKFLEVENGQSEFKISTDPMPFTIALVLKGIKKSKHDDNKI